MFSYRKLVKIPAFLNNYLLFRGFRFLKMFAKIDFTVINLKKISMKVRHQGKPSCIKLIEL